MYEKLKKMDYYELITYFFILAFAGWVFETLSVLILQGKLTDRGLLFVSSKLAKDFIFLNKLPVIGSLPIIWGLPIIPIYGFGGVIIVYCFRNLSNRIVLLFVISMFVMTIFELLGSYFCQYIIHKTYWDYSNEFLNFQGRICLRSSIAWGVLSILVSKLLTKDLQSLYKKISKKTHYKIIANTLVILFLFCSFIKYLNI